MTSIVDYPHHITVEWRVDGWWKTSQTQSRISLSLPCQFLERKFSLNMHEYICLRKLTRWRFERLNQYLNLEKIQINHQSKFFGKALNEMEVSGGDGARVRLSERERRWKLIAFSKRSGWKIDALALFKYEDWLIFSSPRVPLSLASPSPGFCWKSSFARVSIALPTMMTMSMLNKFHHRRRSSL